MISPNPDPIETCAWTDDDGQCDREPHARGFCNAHYQRIRRLEKQGATMADDQQPSGKGQQTADQPAGKSKTKGKGKGSGKVPAKDDLSAVIGMLGLSVWTTYDQYDGERIMESADDLADALVKAARESPALRKTLNALLTGSAWGAVGTALMPMLLPIAEHHGLIGAGATSKVYPRVPTPPGRNRSGPASGSMPDPAGNGHAEGADVTTLPRTPDAPDG